MKFRVHASLIKKLGDELIGNEVTALTEMIKNSYDADASICKIEIDTKIVQNGEIGSIIVEDNGCGMSLDDIEKGWLVISNSKKKKQKENLERTKQGRWIIGEKGIGRLATQKLGRFLKIITKQKESNEEITVLIDWDRFNADSTIDQIEIDYTVKDASAKGSYSRLEIIGLNELEGWTLQDKIDALKKSMTQILSPFSTDDFLLSCKINGELVKINSYDDTIKRHAEATHSFVYEKGKMFLRTSFYPNYFYTKELKRLLKDDEIEDFFNFFNKKYPNVVTYNNLNKEFEFENFIEIDQETIGRGFFEKNIDFGKITCNIDSFSEYSYRTYLKTNYKDVTEYIKENFGIKIIRNNFYIFPYGFGSEGDWLNLADSSAISGSYYALSPVRTIGYLILDEVKSNDLKETTNREGFIRNEYYNHFLNINKFAIKEINAIRNILSRALVSYVKKINDKQNNLHLEHYKKTSEELSKLTAKAITESSELTLDNIKMITEKVEENQLAINRVLDSYNHTLEEKDDQMLQVYELASLGMSSEIFSHEILKQMNVLENNLISIKDFLEKRLNEEKILLLNIKMSLNVIDVLKKQVKMMLPGVQAYRSKIEEISLHELILLFKERNNFLLERNNIKLNTNIPQDKKYNFSIGKMLQVLDNLLDNSIYWLDRTQNQGQIKEKEITIIEKDGELLFYDNGYGVNLGDEVIIFEPFISRKQVNGTPGRGLGLYICSEILKSQKMSIRLRKEKNKFDNYYIFAIELPMQ